MAPADWVQGASTTGELNGNDFIRSRCRFSVAQGQVDNQPVVMKNHWNFGTQVFFSRWFWLIIVAQEVEEQVWNEPRPGVLGVWRRDSRWLLMIWPFLFIGKRRLRISRRRNGAASIDLHQRWLIVEGKGRSINCCNTTSNLSWLVVLRKELRARLIFLGSIDHRGWLAACMQRCPLQSQQSTPIACDCYQWWVLSLSLLLSLKWCKIDHNACGSWLFCLIVSWW